MGRPRADLDGRIAEAVLVLLAREGYERLTMAAVAREARIGRPTLYRRHASKSQLVAAVLGATGPGEPRSLPDDTRQALVVLLASAGQALTVPGALTVMGSLLVEAARDPELTAVFRDAVLRPHRDVVRATLEAGRQRGEVRAGLDVEVVDAMLFGALLARATLGEPLTVIWAARVVDAAWPAIGPHGDRR